jgi:hypothetical protein
LTCSGLTPPHHRAAVGNALDQPLFFKFKQREPNVAAMGLEKITQILFDQPLPRLAPSQYNVFLDTPGDNDGRCRLARRRSAPRGISTPSPLPV